MKKRKLDNLPDELKQIFRNTKERIQHFGNVFFLSEFSFLTTMIVFSTEFNEDREERDIKKCRDVIYEIFDDDEFVDEKADMISEKHHEYIKSMYRQGIVYLWTSLESFIKDLILELIKFDNSYLSSEELSNINIPMSEYFSFDSEDKIDYLADLIYEKTKSSRQRGINRFEGYLKAFDLDGPFNTNHKTNIFILHQIRNCVIHNDSIVDRKFYENCKQLGYDIGDEITISQEEYRKYERSVLAYIMEVFYRLNDHFGAPDSFLNILRDRLHKQFKSITE